MFSSFLSKEFFLFLWTGGVAAIVNFSSRFFYNRFMGFSWAIVAAYLTGMVTAYVLAKTFVFKNTRNSTSQSIFFFTVVNVLALLQTWGISLLLPTRSFQHWEYNTLSRQSPI